MIEVRGLSKRYGPAVAVDGWATWAADPVIDEANAP
jgi:hypothetical protein